MRWLHSIVLLLYKDLIMTTQFESNFNYNGAYDKAFQMMNEFVNMTGLKLNYSHSYIESQMYGYIDKLEDFPKDDFEARYVFCFNEDNKYENVNFIPSDNKVLVWRYIDNSSPYSGDYEEGAVNPKTGKTKWFDWPLDGAYKLPKWKTYRMS